jgi:chromosome segregation ATPase
MPNCERVREKASQTPIQFPCELGWIFATIEGVKAAFKADKLYQAQTEIRHLKNTIQALRDELEAMRTAKDEAVQAVVAAGADEARQLQGTIAALRNELEQKMFQHAGELERQKHLASDELRLLRETIAALRAELEGSRLGRGYGAPRSQSGKSER